MSKYPTPIAAIKSAQPQLSDIQNEDLLDLELSPMDDITAQLEINESNVYLRIGYFMLPHEINTIPIRKFDLLFLAATALKTAATAHYITGIKIYFGINQSGIITLIYVPVIMEWDHDVNPDVKSYNVREGAGYIYNGTVFTPITIAQYSFLTNYKNNIRILHPGDITPTSFISGRDSEAAIFPFQTIYTVENDNPGMLEITIYNSIRKTLAGSNNDIQHCLLLSPITINKLLAPFTGKFANRSHLCPPDCSPVSYRMA